MSNIIVCLRTLNERPHLARFLWGYDWASRILVADGGSTDGTREFLSSHPLVTIRNFTEFVEHPVSGVRRNPEGKHINFLLDWAEEEEADWIILDDADSTPNPRLRNRAREALETCRMDTLWAFRMYLWGTRQWFPRLTGDSVNPGDAWAGLWAWRPGIVRWSERDPYMSETEEIGNVGKEIIRYPYALLHYFCLTPKIVERKLKRYSGTLEGGMKHPLETCGPLQELPTWATS